MADRAASIADNLSHIRERLERAARRVGRDPSDVTIVAVTKTVPAEVVASAVRLGLTCLGENRVQEAAAKAPKTRALLSGTAGIQWHLIGHLQTNKIRQALKVFDVIQSVDSVRLASQLSLEAGRAEQIIRILLEVNVGREPAKHGILPEELHAAVHEIAQMPHILVHGLMTVPPFVGNAEQTRPVFMELRGWQDKLRALRPEIDWHHLSMGMSDDFEVAIEEGATMVRLGRALFGDRPPAAP